MLVLSSRSFYSVQDSSSGNGAPHSEWVFPPLLIKTSLTSMARGHLPSHSRIYHVGNALEEKQTYKPNSSRPPSLSDFRVPPCDGEGRALRTYSGLTVCSWPSTVSKHPFLLLSISASSVFPASCIHSIITSCQPWAVCTHDHSPYNFYHHHFPWTAGKASGLVLLCLP